MGLVRHEIKRRADGQARKKGKKLDVTEVMDTVLKSRNKGTMKKIKVYVEQSVPNKMRKKFESQENIIYVAVK